MTSTVHPVTNAVNPKVPMDEMLKLMGEMCDILRQHQKDKTETEMPKHAPRPRTPGQEGIREEERKAEGPLANASEKPIVPPTRAGMRKEDIRCINPLAANYDYCMKYPEDAQYREHDSEARVWWVYNDEATMFDKNMIDELGDSLDVLLIFAGLFSGVITTFVAQTSQALSVDATSLSASYLREITAILRADGNISAISQIPAAGDIWVNRLWFASLTMALSVALFAVLAKQWLRQYMSVITGTPRDRAFIRQFRFDGLKRWKVPEIIGILPVLL